MIFVNFQQGSEEWINVRAGKITASRFKDARDTLKSGAPSGKCTGYAAQVALERIARRPIDKTFQNWQMREGQEQESFARMAYEASTGAIVEEVGAVMTDDELFLYSPDGFVGDDGLLEIKTILSGEVALNVCGRRDLSGYLDQCLGGMWLTGRKWIDLVTWCPALEPIGKHYTVHRIERDDNRIEALENDLMKFAAMVSSFETELRKEAA
jgi:exodeoxyribonuclease (lambda-induced)